MDAAGPILLCAGDHAAADDLARPLEAAGYAVRRYPFSPDEMGLNGKTLLFVLDGRGNDGEALQCCRRLRAHPSHTAYTILIVLADASPASRLACLDAGADAYLARPFAARELTIQVRTLLENQQNRRRAVEKAAEAQQTCQRLRQAYRQIDQDLAAVRQIQRSYLPRSLPQIPGLTLAAHYHPCGQVGGDSYDAFRLDESHVGFYVADALGHGTPAGLLTMFLKQAVQGKNVNGHGYSLVAPDEVLRRLNRSLIEQALTDLPFVTMVYGLYDARVRTLRFARAGHPAPLYVPRDGELESWNAPGNLLGVFSTEFTQQVRPLQPGDKVLLYTDGLDETGGDQPTNPAKLIECAARHRKLPVQRYVEQLAHELLGQTSTTDDFTLLGLEVPE